MTQQMHDPRYGTAQPFPPVPPAAPLGRPPFGQPSLTPPAGFGAPQPAPRKKPGAIVGSILGVLVVVGGIFLGTTTIDTAEAERPIAALTEDQVGVGGEAVATCDADGRSVLVDPVGAPIPCTVTNATDSTDSTDVLAAVNEAGDVSYAAA